MKRRSARPFTVEIKHTRTSLALLTDATERSRKSQDLWRDLPVIATDKPFEAQRTPIAHSKPARPEVPVRRVLPSLVPMFAMPIEPETPKLPEALEAERIPRVRRSKQTAQRQQQPSAQRVPAPSVAAKPMVQPQFTPAIAALASAQAPTASREPGEVQPRPARRKQQVAALRPGERWKRRLPRVLW